MEKRLILPLLLLLTVMVQAQDLMHITMKDGTVHDYRTDEIAHITFSPLAPKGTAANPYTVAELQEACTGLGANDYLNGGDTVCARGIVTQVKEASAEYGNITYFISDGPEADNQFYVFRGYLLNKAKVQTGLELTKGDTVVVCGRVKNYKGNMLEFDSGSYLLEQRGATPSADVLNAYKRLEFPQCNGSKSNFVLVHTAKLNDRTGEQGINYSTEWDTALRAQRWSCYQLYQSVLETNTNRSQSSYPEDTFLPLSYRFDDDPYKGSGYDHGHICPSADRLASVESNTQTFFMTNMQPQKRSFNSGTWKSMEDRVRTWATSFDTLYICKGGTIDKAEQINGYIGGEDNQIPVPKYFFMALMGKQPTGYTALGFWIEQEASTQGKTLKDYVVNIRELEQLTGIDFFHNLPDDIEEAVETLPTTNIISVWNLD